MNDNIWKKISFYVGLLPLGALFGLAVFVANIEIKDLDLWLHLAMGRFISLHHYVPHVDILSCTISGAHWVNHEWLFQVIVYNIFNLWGPEGLLKMQVVVVALTMFFLLLLGFNREKQLTNLFIFLLVFLIYQQRFTIRPDIYSLFFFVLNIYILALHIDKKWALWALFVIQVIWSNMHGFFFFGPLFVFIGLISEWMKRHLHLPYQWNEVGRLTDEEYHRIKRIFVVVVLACLLNPHFIKGAWYPLGVFFSLSGENKIFFDHIQELQKPLRWDTLFSQGQYIYYKLLIFLSLLSFYFNRRRIDISALIFWIIFLVFSLKAVRNIAFFALAGYLVYITNVYGLSFKEFIPLRFTSKKFQHLTSIFLKITILIWIFVYCRQISVMGYYDFDTYKRKSEFGGVSKRFYPYKAADFLVENEIKGNFFNDFNSGAYLLGRCFPNIKVFIDGRTEVYGGAFFKKYQKVWDQGDTVLLEKALEKYNITGAFLNSVRRHIQEDILKYFYDHKDWVAVYFNYDAVIFLKKTADNEAYIEKHTVDFASLEVDKKDLFKIGPSRVYPYQNYYRGYTLETLDFDDLALAEADESINLDPSYGEAYQLKGKIYTKREEYQKAFENFRIAAQKMPQSRDAQYNLALAYIDLEEYEGAIIQYRRITGRWNNDPKAFFFLAKAYALNKQYEEAVKILKIAHKLDPRDTVDLVKIGDIMVEQKEYGAAKEAYDIAISTQRNLAKTYKKLGDLAKIQEQYHVARKQYQEVLRLSPGNEEIIKELEQLETK